MGSNPSSRRKILRKIGVATSTATLGSLSITSRTAASTTATIADGPWNDYEPWQEDRLDTCTEDGCISPSSTVYVPNPGSFGFSLCVETDIGQVCISQEGTLTQNYYSCAGRELWTASVDITKFEYGEIVWSQSGWLGIDISGCWWIGLDSGAGETVCRQFGCPSGYSTDDTVWDLRYFLDTVAQDTIDFVQEQTDGNPSTYVEIVATGAGVAGAAVLLRRQVGISAGPLGT